MKSYSRSFFCLLLLPLFACGCVGIKNLPLVTAKNFEYSRTNLVSSATVTAKGVNVTQTEVTAEAVDASLTYPIVGTITVKIEGYRRDRNNP